MGCFECLVLSGETGQLYPNPERSLCAAVIVTLVPCEGSETYVNGKRVIDAIQLRSGKSLTLSRHVNTLMSYQL